MQDQTMNIDVTSKYHLSHHRSVLENEKNERNDYKDITTSWADMVRGKKEN